MEGTVRLMPWNINTLTPESTSCGELILKDNLLNSNSASELLFLDTISVVRYTKLCKESVV